MQSAINSCNSLHLHSKHRRRDFRDLVFFFLEHGSVSTEEEIIGRRRSQFLRMFTGRTSTFLSLSGLHSLHYRLPRCCLKAYHPEWLGKDSTFLETGDQWTCRRAG
ncbi:uncharacterized protein LOC131231542 isoform X2 [Magnolia sinica]|uniref:uncharacterized protein LOC131231542 isoform X2 n=1 Tax=Magnolia sinica TaxID=86752 RepID=UPI0026590CB2|nr:uncharacterized protein LOC131231542 isoform X2 [Magnolia sinica]